MPSEEPWPPRPLFPPFLSLAAEESGTFPPPPPLLFLSFLFLHHGSMDLSKVGEKILGSVRSARSLAALPLPSSDHRPEVPERAAAAAAVARALAGIPPHERIGIPSSSAELASLYGGKYSGPAMEELEEDFYEEEFDAVRNILENVPLEEEDDVEFFEKKAAHRLAQLDFVTEQLSRHVMEHHEKMVKGMNLVMEVQEDLKIASVISTNGRRNVVSSLNEVSRDLVVTSNAKRKQFLLDMIPILIDLGRAMDMQMELEVLIEEDNYFKAFQVLSEYLQVLECYSELSVTQELNRGVESWLAKTLHKLDALLLSVCQDFKAESYRTVVDAYALIGDVGGLAEKIQSCFMQELLTKTHSALKDLILKEAGSNDLEGSRVTYSDLCLQIPESKFRHCLLVTLGILFKLLCSFYAIMSYQPEKKDLGIQTSNENSDGFESPCYNTAGTTDTSSTQRVHLEEKDKDLTTNSASTSESAFDVLRSDAVSFVAQSLSRGRKHLWQLTTSRISVLLSCSAVCSASTFQFLKNYEDINLFILAGEGFCGVEALEFRRRLKYVCESYVSAFHRQNTYALKMVLDKETWFKISPDSTQVIALAGLIGDGAPVISPKDGDPSQISAVRSGESGKGDGFSQWLKVENPFFLKLTGNGGPLLNESVTSTVKERESSVTLNNNVRGLVNGKPCLDDENEDLLADYIDEDSQLPSRTSKPSISKNCKSQWSNEDVTAHTGSSLCLLRLMDNYGRLMQKLQLVNVEFFKGICELFELFFHFVYETVCQLDAFSNGKGLSDIPSKRLKIALMRASQVADKYTKSQFASSVASPGSATFSQIDVSPTSPANHSSSTTFGLKERCVAAENISLVAKILWKARSHLQSMLTPQNAMVEEFYANMVDVVPDLIMLIHRTSSRILLHINGYVDRIASAKWELKELGVEHNGYVDLLLGEFKHYKTRLAHGGIQKEVQDLLVEYGLENVAETLVEGLSRVKKCTDEGRALMLLDLQVLINGLQHFVSVDVKPKMQIVEHFIKAYYLPEPEYVHWARSHPEYTKSQIVALVNLVASVKSWKRKSRLEVIEKIEAGV